MVLHPQVKELQALFPKSDWHKCSITNLVLYRAMVTNFTDQMIKDCYLGRLLDPDTYIDTTIIKSFSDDEFRAASYYTKKVNEFAPLDVVTDADVQEILDLYNHDKTPQGLRNFWFMFMSVHPFEYGSTRAATIILGGLAHHYYPKLKKHHLCSRWYALLRRCTYHAAGTASSIMFDALMEGNIELATTLWIAYLPEFLQKMTTLEDVQFEIMYLNLILNDFQNYPVNQFVVEGCECEVCAELTKLQAVIDASRIKQGV